MKKLITLFVASAMTISSLYAAPVSVNVAQTVAANFYGQTFNQSATSVVLTYTGKDPMGAATYYVFNINDKGGFVIVSAEDAGHPIIGCSNKGAYVVPSVKSNLGFWMQKRNTEIIANRSLNVTATADVTDEWTSYINNAKPKQKFTHKVQGASLFPSSSAYLVKSTYDQEGPYWDDCPDSSGTYSVTGCVATCMVQIMRYWQYPATGIGSNTYYANISYLPGSGNLTASFNHPYGWSTMQLTSPPSADTNLARAMSDAGISVDMSYSPSGSGAQVLGGYPSAEYSYTNYFKYSNAIIHGMNELKDTTTWQDTLENDLDHSRPIEYEGFDATAGGHTWVCDGYNSNNAFHMNWGWSGFDNGWYTVAKLNAGGYDFTEDDGAVIGIMPPPVTAAPVAMFTSSSLACTNSKIQFFDTSSGQPTGWKWTFQGATVDTSTIQNPTATYTATGTYAVSLVATNAIGSDSLGIVGYVTVTATPATPTFTRSGDTLIASPANLASYVWYKSNVVIAGQSSNKLLLTANGAYKVTGYSVAGCSATSASVIEGSVGINEISYNQYIKAFPNPTQGNLQVAFNMPSDGDYNVAVTNVLGQTVYATTLHIAGEYTQNIDLSSFSKGMYILSITGKDGKGEQKYFYTKSYSL